MMVMLLLLLLLINFMMMMMMKMMILMVVMMIMMMFCACVCVCVCVSEFHVVVFPCFLSMFRGHRFGVPLEATIPFPRYQGSQKSFNSL